jgi:serine/alanine adding enzyme
MQVVNSLDQVVWRDFLESNPQAQVFHTPEMYEVFARAKRHSPSLWAAVSNDGRVLALLPTVHVTAFDGPLGSFTARNIAYGGALYEQGPKGIEALSTLLGAYRRALRLPALYTEIRNLSGTDGVQRTLADRGFLYEEHLNFLINLQRSPEEILQSCGTRTRAHVRHALRQGKVEINEINDRNQIKMLYDVLRLTYSHSGVPLSDFSLFEAAFDVLHPRNMVRFTVAIVEEKPVAVSVELLYKDVVYGWYGGTAREYSAFRPNEVLTWNQLEWGATHGFHIYDFGGAGKPGEPYGPRDFKAKFGGELVSFGRNICVHTPHLIRLSQWGYEMYQRASSRAVNNRGVEK